ncbi:hypothetical protein GE061_018822 [Apolygus lucorum]|uniref:LRRCT domain-containing protein n=1 Tax=Apolygus lucorum TaxID=248454 RepID=A0A8S9X6N4_APOLU|nr:hypothetical protein GE061_018822 [Apolygus lucorum]
MTRSKCEQQMYFSEDKPPATDFYLVLILIAGTTETSNSSLNLRNADYGNPLVCDCRLDWLHSLYNSSNSESVRTTIEEMTCIQSLNDLDSEPLRARMPDNPIGDSPTQDSMEPFSEKNFMAIPRESLPCPQDLRATGVPAVQLATKTESSGLKTSQSLVLIVLSVCLLFP